MSMFDHRRGGAALGALSHMEIWEATLVMNLRLWCDGPNGQSQVWNEYRRAMPPKVADKSLREFETLMRLLTECSHRALVRHDIACNCVGADECIFLHLVRTASEGHLTDAALISTLLIGAAHAERAAILAGEVGLASRTIACAPRLAQTAQAGSAKTLH